MDPFQFLDVVGRNLTTCKRSMQSRGTLAIYDARMHVEDRMHACTINLWVNFKVELILRFLPELSDSSWFIIGLGVQRRSVTLASKVDGNMATPCMMQPVAGLMRQIGRTRKLVLFCSCMHALQHTALNGLELVHPRPFC